MTCVSWCPYCWKDMPPAAASCPSCDWTPDADERECYEDAMYRLACEDAADEAGGQR